MQIGFTSIRNISYLLSIGRYIIMSESRLSTNMMTESFDSYGSVFAMLHKTAKSSMIEENLS